MLTGLALSALGILRAMPFDKNSSSFLKIVPDPTSPQFNFFAIDSLGKNNLKTNIILHEDIRADLHNIHSK